MREKSRAPKNRAAIRRFPRTCPRPLRAIPRGLRESGARSREWRGARAGCGFGFAACRVCAECPLSARENRRDGRPPRGRNRAPTRRPAAPLSRPNRGSGRRETFRAGRAPAAVLVLSITDMRLPSRAWEVERNISRLRWRERDSTSIRTFSRKPAQRAQVARAGAQVFSHVEDYRARGPRQPRAAPLCRNRRGPLPTARPEPAPRPTRARSGSRAEG